MIIKPKIDKPLPYSESIFQILILLGYYNSVIFGGSIRDFIINNYKTDTINDYDIRIISDEKPENIANKLKKHFGDYEIKKQLGSEKIRFIFYYKNKELDISIRSNNENNNNLIKNITQRVLESDAAISSFVLSSDLIYYCRNEAIKDINNNTLTFYYSDNDDKLKYYVSKMNNKYPNRENIFSI